VGNLSPFHPFRRLRRARLLRQPFPQSWLEYLQRNLAVYHQLTPAEQARLRDDLLILVAEKSWEGCGGLQITDEMQVTIAAQACVLLLGMEHDYYGAVPTIVVYPSGFLIPEEDMGADGVIRGVHALGQAWYRGPVVLAWDDALGGGHGLRQGHNVVYHEFAHQLDFQGDWAGHKPARTRREHLRAWQQVMTQEYEQLVQAAQQGTPALLDYYGATNPREFFAVATACFFTQPLAMQSQHPRLYDVLREYYNQDPAARQQGTKIAAGAAVEAQ